jgi:hypothetical protein
LGNKGKLDDVKCGFLEGCGIFDGSAKGILLGTRISHRSIGSLAHCGDSRIRGNDIWDFGIENSMKSLAMFGAIVNSGGVKS